MKIDHLSFPHPVLNLHDDISSGSYRITHSVQKNRDEIVISVEHDLLQSSLEHLIENREACFLTEVHCPQTLFRVAYISHDPEQTIIIPSKDLRDFVEISFFIVAGQDISPYEIKEANKDYSGFKIEVARGDVLAYGGRDNFFAEKKWEAQKSVSNFMEIRPLADLNGPVKFFLGEEKIIVNLPAGDFKFYSKLVGYDQFAPMFHSSIVLPALMFALTEMIEDGEQYENLSWYKVIQSRRNSDEKIKKMAWERENVPEIAQAILSNPVERSLWGMKKVVDQFISTNDE
jgi:hypothetical protein